MSTKFCFRLAQVEADFLDELLDYLVVALDVHLGHGQQLDRHLVAVPRALAHLPEGALADDVAEYLPVRVPPGSTGPEGWGVERCTHTHYNLWRGVREVDQLAHRVGYGIHGTPCGVWLGRYSINPAA